MSGRTVHKVDPTKTNEFYVNKNRVFHYAYFIGNPLYDRYGDLLKKPANSYEIALMIQDAWQKLAAAIRRHDSGTELFWDIPFPQAYDRHCVEIYIQCPDLRENINRGELPLKDALLICRMKGFWI